MTVHERYDKLYRLQDVVLNTVFADETSFYLTGGTCLHRFYFDARYSDDLDLFTSDTTTYRDDVRLILERLQAESIVLETTVDTRDFARVLVEKELQVDFVNDRVYRFGTPRVGESSVRIDNLENIAANKICAIIGRDEPKDVFDLCMLLQSGTIDVGSVLSAAAEKCIFDRELLEQRLRSFPVELLDSLTVKDESFAGRLKSEYSSIIKPLLQE